MPPRSDVKATRASRGTCGVHGVPFWVRLVRPPRLKLRLKLRLSPESLTVHSNTRTQRFLRNRATVTLLIIVNFTTRQISGPESVERFLERLAYVFCLIID
jgi:hypothetical protein